MKGSYEERLLGCLNVAQAIFNTFVLILTLSIFLLAPTLVSSSHLGIGGEQINSQDEYHQRCCQRGCLCHTSLADNTVQIVLDEVPMHG